MVEKTECDYCGGYVDVESGDCIVLKDKISLRLNGEKIDVLPKNNNSNFYFCSFFHLHDYMTGLEEYMEYGFKRTEWHNLESLKECPVE